MFDAARLFRARGLSLHLLTSGVLLERLAPDVARHFSRVVVSLDAHDRVALPRRARRGGADDAWSGAWRRSGELAPDAAGDGPRDAAPAQLPRAAGAHRPCAGRWALDGISFLPADSRRRRSAGRRPRRSRSLGSRCRPRWPSSTAVVEQTIAHHADDFASGFVAESPDKLRRLPQVLRGARRATAPFPPRQLQRAVDLGRGRGRRRRCGPASSISAIGNIRQAPLGAIVARRSLGVPRDARRRDQSGVHAVRVLDEDRLEERAVAVAERAAPVPEDTQHAFDGVAADLRRARTPATAMLVRDARRVARGARPRALSGGGRVLDLGLRSRHRRPSTGDARLPRDGHRLVAGDGRRGAPPGARGRALPSRVDVRRLGIDEIDRLAAGLVRRAPGRTSGRSTAWPTCRRPPVPSPTRLRPGGILVASVIGRVCPWEIGAATWRAATGGGPALRFARGFVAVPLGRDAHLDAVLLARASSSGRSTRPGSRRAVAASARRCSRRRRTWSGFAGASSRRSSSALWRVEDPVGASARRPSRGAITF